MLRQNAFIYEYGHNKAKGEKRVDKTGIRWLYNTPVRMRQS